MFNGFKLYFQDNHFDIAKIAVITACFFIIKHIALPFHFFHLNPQAFNSLHYMYPHENKIAKFTNIFYIYSEEN